jgi:DNA-binding transcriptional regulator YhcF (GntR family)
MKPEWVRQAVQLAKSKSLECEASELDPPALVFGALSTAEGKQLLDVLGLPPTTVLDAIVPQIGYAAARTGATVSAQAVLNGAQRVARLHDRAEIGVVDVLTAAMSMDRYLRNELAKVGITYQSLDQSQLSGDNNRSGWRARIDPAQTTPLYEQIIQRIQESIALGELSEGDRLPPVRQLSEDLNIAPGTVARAYSALEERKLVITDGARGTRVAPASIRAAGGVGIADIMEMMLPVALRAYHNGLSADELRSAFERVLKPIFRL